VIALDEGSDLTHQHCIDVLKLLVTGVHGQKSRALFLEWYVRWYGF
jgi:hypothetical protein